MPQIKIGIFGAHSTGKSTFLKRIESELTKLDLSIGTIGGLAVEARNLGFPILKNHTFESTLWLMTRGISLELEQQSKDVLLVDRPTIDALGYLLAALEYRGETLSSDKKTYLFNLATCHSMTYHHLVFSKLAGPAQIDPNKPRDTDEQFRRLVDQKLSELAENLPLPVLLLERSDETDATVLAKLLSTCWSSS